MNDALQPIASSRLIGRWLCTIGLVCLPVLLAVGFYYRPAWQDGKPLPLDGDAWFYAYQMERAGETHGQWWKLANDDLLGQPYPTIAAKHPGLYEGVDLLLISAVTSRFLSPVVNYHVLVLIVLAGNGWVVGFLVRRLTQSYFWAAVAVIIVTLNMSTAFRLNGHLHLFKHAWVALAAWAFAGFLEMPSLRRGLLLGLALALVVQGSFYIGFFITLAIGLYGLGCLLKKRLSAQHGLAGTAAWLTYGVLGALFTFPVWMTTLKTPLSDLYFHRYQGESAIYSSEIWQYFESPHWKFQHKPGEAFFAPVGEGWHYPGYLVLGAIALYAIARLKGWQLTAHRQGCVSTQSGQDPLGITTAPSFHRDSSESASTDKTLALSSSRAPRWVAVKRALTRRGLLANKPSQGAPERFVDVLMGLTGILVLVSLKNGPSVMLATWVSCFRCYGRAGLATVGLWSVAAPMILSFLVAKVRSSWLRAAAALPILALALFDGYQGEQSFYYSPASALPSWVTWLADQPDQVHLAAFSAWDVNRKTPREAWDWDGLYYRLIHRHRTLNGCEPNLLEGDLRLLGASYQNMNPLGLRYIVSLGYETLAFHRDYLDANSWIAALPWMDRIEMCGDWHIYRANANAVRLPTMTMRELLGRQKTAQTPRKVPALAWITEPLDAERMVVVGSDASARLAWADMNGQLVTRPTLGLFQHAYGPGVPAYSIETPSKPGSYLLLFLDAAGMPMASKQYEIVAGMPTSRQAFGDETPHLRLSLQGPDESTAGVLRAVVENTTSAYIQAHGNRPQVQHSIRSHPGLFDLTAPWADSLTLVIWHHTLGDREPARELRLLLPRDVPPGDRVVIDLPDSIFQGMHRHRSTTAASVEPDVLIDVRLEQVGVMPFAP